MISDRWFRVGLLINNIDHIQQFECDDIVSDLVVNRKSKTFRIFLADNAKKHVLIINIYFSAR